ncbi:tetratricopeptide repeat protein, partial [Paraglaciecola sp.]|uniref:tetratricopeptide repeat protein n=1 Tax=Paraglaciecola sp. TaxID=1920173 RepID=UPI003EF250E9
MLSSKNNLLFVILSLIAFNLAAQSSSHYEKALKSYEESNFDESYIHLKNALQDNPSDLAAKILMGEVLLSNGYFNEALVELEEALLQGADPNLVIKNYGKSLVLNKKFNDILLLSLEGLNKKNQFEVHVLKATAYASLDDQFNAEKSYLLAQSLEPNDIRTINSLIILYLKQNNLVKSKEFLDLSFKLNDKHAGTWRLKGLIEKQQNQTAQAMISFEKAYNLNQQDPFVLRAYADALWQAKRVEEAEVVLNKILKQTPDDPYVKLLLSQVLTISDKSKEAQALLNNLSEELTVLESTNSTSNLALRFASGMTAYLSNNYEQALADITFYVNNSEQNINTLSVLVDINLKLKKQRDALKLLESNESLVIQNLDIALVLCDLYLNSNRAFKCESLSNTLKETYPNKAKVDFIRAKTLVARDKPAQAIEVLKSISDPIFQNQRQLAIAHLLFQMKNFAESHAIAKSLLIDLPDDIDVLDLNVALLIKQQDSQQAQTLVDKILSINPEHVAALYNHANILGAQGHYEQALNIMQKLEKANSLQAGSYILYANLLASNNNVAAAIEKLKFASKLDDSSVPISEKLIELYIQAEDYKKALWEIELYSRKTFSDEKYTFTKAELMYQLGQVEESKNVLSSQYDKWENSSDKLIELSRIQLKLKDNTGGEKTLLQVLKLHKNAHLPALLALTNLYANANKTDLANKYLTIANKLYPKKPSVLVALGKLEIQLGKYNEASVRLWNVLNIDQDYVPAYGQLYQLSNKGVGTERFIKRLNASLEKSPDNHLFRNLLADTYLQNGFNEEAFSQYKILSEVENYANLAPVLNNLAFLTIDADLGKALSLVERGLGLAANSVSLIDTKGWILALQGNYSEALELLRQAYS